jgi:hypothetical protein
MPDWQELSVRNEMGNEISWRFALATPGGMYPASPACLPRGLYGLNEGNAAPFVGHPKHTRFAGVKAKFQSYLEQFRPDWLDDGKLAAARARWSRLNC